MGSVLQDNNKRMKTSASRYSALAVSAAVIGIAVLLFQAYSIYTGKEFKPFNIEVGSLWNADANSGINQPIQENDIVLEVIPQRNNLSSIVKPSIIKSRDYFKVSTVKNARIMDPERSERSMEMLERNVDANKRLDMLSIGSVFNNTLSMKYFKQLQNDYLVDPNLQPAKGKWFIGFSFAPSLSYRQFNYAQSDIAGMKNDGNTVYVYGMTESYRNTSDRLISSFYTGIDFGVSLSKRWTISSGIYYAVYGESISITSIEDRDINAQEARYYGQEPLYASPDNKETGENLSYDNRYSYVEVPLNVEYCITDDEMGNISIQAGAYLRKLDHVNALIYDFDTDFYYWLPKNDLEIYKDLGIGVMGGVNFSQFVSKHVEVFVNPQIKYNLHSTFAECYPVDQHHYSTGLRLGIKQHLN